MPKVKLEVQRQYREPGARRAEVYGPGESVDVPKGLADALKREKEEGIGENGRLFGRVGQAPVGVSDTPREMRQEARVAPREAEATDSEPLELPRGYTAQTKAGGWIDIFDADGNKVDTVRGGEEYNTLVAELQQEPEDEEGDEGDEE